MTVAYHLRGYHTRTGALGQEFVIGASTLLDVRRALRETGDDPELIDPHELGSNQARQVAEALGVSIDTERFDYFVEAEEDWRVVAAIRDARFVEV